MTHFNPINALLQLLDLEDSAQAEDALYELFDALIAKYPVAKGMAAPDPASVRYVRLTPVVISILDYSKGFGHTELVEIAPEDLTRAA